jgi:tripartite-type tricarboxylate transporter receptor subunit TctC
MTHRSAQATRRRLTGALAGAAAALPLAGFAPRARAQAWPSKTIRLVLPSGPGGGADLFGRLLAEYMSQELKVTVVVDNKPGATGIVAHEAVVRQPPDGYNLVISFTAAMIGNKLLQPKMSHDPLVDLMPIARIGGGGGNALVVNPELPVKNLKDLLDWAKAKPDQSYASWGVASGGHLVMEMIKQRTGMKINHVPYKTVSQIPTDVVSGVVPVAWIDAATPVPFVKSGRLRAIAVASSNRLPQFPDVATLGEQGIQSDAEASYGLLGPAGMPMDIVERLNAIVNKWLVLPATAAYFESKQNVPAPTPLTQAQYVKVLERDLAAWTKLIAESKVTL